MARSLKHLSRIGTHMMQRPRDTSWELLAGIRFTLAAIVVFGHIRWLGAPCPTFVRICDFCPFTAVLCFLVISGYSMAHSVASRPAGFLVRRVTRIYPMYALSVLIGLVPAALLGWTTGRTWKDAVMNLGFLQTFHCMPIVGNGVTWSLAVEVAFYALTPLLARMATVGLLGCAAVSAAAFVAFPYLHLPYFNLLTHGLPFLFLGWAWLAGFIFYRCRAQPLAGGYLIAAMVLLTTLNPMFAERRHELTVVIAMLAVVASGTGAQIPSRVRPVLSFLGDLSFPLYLFHAPVILFMVGYHHWVHPWGVAGLSFAAGLVMLTVDRQAKRPFQRGVEWAVALPRPALAAAAAEFARVAPAIWTAGSGHLARAVRRAPAAGVAAISLVLAVVTRW